jgi:hypothetical protein
LQWEHGSLIGGRQHEPGEGALPCILCDEQLVITPLLPEGEGGKDKTDRSHEHILLYYNKAQCRLLLLRNCRVYLTNETCTVGHVEGANSFMRSIIVDYR